MRFLLVVLVGVLLLCPLAGAEETVPTEMPQVEALGAILIDRESGRVLYELNADQMLPIASTTKVMTALITLEKCDLDEIVTTSAGASGVPGTSIYLGVGEQLSVKQMLQGLLLRSGNDAAVALAEHVAGTVEDFAELMNQRAAQLGAQANFVTPNGLDAPGHQASARAMALIANEAMDFPAFRQIVLTQRAVLPWRDSPYDRVLTNKNKLLASYEGATGVKTGFTKKAGRCLIFSAQRGDMELLGVVLNCAQWFDAAKALLDWGFDHFGLKEYLYAGERAACVRVIGGMEEEVHAVAPVKLRVPLRQGETVRLIVEAEDTLEAPVAAGTPIGRAQVVVDGQVVAQRVLVAEKNVPVRTFGAAFERVLRYFNPAE